MMLLEHNITTTGGKKHSHEPRDESTDAMIHTVTGTFDPFKGAQQQAPITTQNKYSALESRNDSDDEDDGVRCTNYNG